METIVAGSIEHFVVTVTDRLEALNDLSPLTPKYDVLDKDDNYMMTNEDIDADGMVCKCLIDTTQPTEWNSGIYRLFIKFTASPEVPIHGPFPFRVESR